jgi:hypothetical protein
VAQKLYSCCAVEQKDINILWGEERRIGSERSVSIRVHPRLAVGFFLRGSSAAQVFMS